MRPEDMLQKGIVDYLELLKNQGRLTFFSVPNEAKRSFKTTSWLKAMGMHPGAADLVIVWNGGVGFVECKSPKGIQSDNQIAFMNSVRSFGHQYVMVRSMDDLKGALMYWGVIPQLAVA